MTWMRMLAWGAVTAGHGLAMLFLMTAWLFTPRATLLPSAVLLYWKLSSNVCHVSSLEAALHPRGYALFRPMPKWSSGAVAAVQIVALLSHMLH